MTNTVRATYNAAQVLAALHITQFWGASCWMYATRPSTRGAFLPFRMPQTETRSVLKHFACITVRGLSLGNRRNVRLL